MSSSKRPTRFLPTLTEVVLPISGVNSDSDPGQCQEASVARITARVVASVQMALREVAPQIIQEHMLSLEARIQSEIDTAVTTALIQALADDDRTTL